MGLSLSSLAEMLGVDKSRVSQIEAGNDSLSFQSISKICVALHIHPALLLSLDPESASFNDGIQSHSWPKR